MSSSSDKAFIQSQTASLLRPLFASTSSSLPPPLTTALNASFSRNLKIKLGSSAVRQAVDQLGELRAKEWRAGERRRDKARKGLVVVRKDHDLVDELLLVGEWPTAGEEEEDGNEDAQRYGELLKRVQRLRKKKARVEQQLAHYKELQTLASSLNRSVVEDHSLEDPDSALRLALARTEELLPSAVESVEGKADETVAAKRTKARFIFELN
ncbi:hypothetical protein RQP46_001335 [Phenoliferia psychrophenolica]